MPGKGPGDVVSLGVVTRPQGVRGEVRVHPFNKDSDLLLELSEVLLISPRGEARRVRITQARRMPKVVVLRIEGIGTVEDAETLREATVAIPREALPPPERDEFYLVDAVGLAVRLTSGEPVGEVVEIMEYPSVTCLRVRVDEGYLEVPLLPAWVDRVDPEGGEVVLLTIDDLPVEAPRPPKNEG